ncbi:deoxynucleoside kinase, partial [Lacticaseibacillus saniviri]
LYDYYKELNQRYAAWYDDYDESPKMQIDGDKLDFVENEADRKTVIAMIDDKLKQLDAVTD